MSAWSLFNESEYNEEGIADSDIREKLIAATRKNDGDYYYAESDKDCLVWVSRVDITKDNQVRVEFHIDNCNDEKCKELFSAVTTK